jgi:2-polyprenyl-6-methoxyphenol hydroxylase-like FAD-dependent oxidoreductase
VSKGSVLISGAGIAGSTLAYWLVRQGFRPTVVERAESRSSGSPVDVRGPALEVAERMGILARIRDAATDVTDIIFVNATGRRVAKINMRALQPGPSGADVELPRGDLASILLEAGRDQAEFLVGDSIVALQQDEDGVGVNFDRAGPRHFDLVIGADGLHSVVRRLEFGPESEFVQHLGIYIATMPLDAPIENRREVFMYNTPGKAVTIHPGRDRPLVAFMFRSAAVPGFDHRDMEQHKRLLAATFAHDAWRVPELLDLAQTSTELYFDSVSQVRVQEWAHDRVALVGDAASCVSLFGDGSSMAIAGAFTLAEELGASPRDRGLAFRRYEARHRTLVDPRQRRIGRGAAFLIPETQRGIFVRNLALRMVPVVAAVGSLGRRLTPGAGPDRSPR